MNVSLSFHKAVDTLMVLFKLGGCGGMAVVCWGTRGVRVWSDDGARGSCFVGSVLPGGLQGTAVLEDPAHLTVGHEGT